MPLSDGLALAAVVGLLVVALGALVVLHRRLGRLRSAMGEWRQSAEESRERLSIVLEHASVALWAMDRDLRITWAEGRGPGVPAEAPKGAAGPELPELWPASDLEAPAAQAYHRALSGEPAHCEMEWNGRLWEVGLHPLWEDDEVTGVVGTALDATRHRDVERRLEEQSAYFQKLFEEAPEAIVLVDEEDRILQVNPEFEAVFGYGADEAVGHRVNELISEPGREAEATELTRRVASGERLQVETVRRHKDGTHIDVSILATPMEVGGRRRVYGIYRDITERKTLEAQLLHSQRLEAVGQLAGGVAHDFNNILTAILGHTRVLLEESPAAGLRKDLEQIEAAAERAARLTRQLLTFSRRDMVSSRVVDVNAVLREARAFLARLIEERVELAMELADDLPPVQADPGRLEQVVVNLVINARDAMPDGGRITLTTRRVDDDAGPTRAAAPGAGVEAPRIVLEVRDTGRGMSPDEEARMFEPFFTTKAPGEGTGLGLSTVYGIVEQAGGAIEVDTAPGAGTTVRIHLPATGEVEAPETDPRPAPPTPDPGSAGPGGGELILLVDDDRPVRDVARRILERAAYRVVAVESGPAALEYCESGGVVPDAVVTDIVMPGMTGYELADRLKERYPGIRVLLMTGYTDVASGDHGGPAGILRKPFDATTLVARVREALDAP